MKVYVDGTDNDNVILFVGIMNQVYVYTPPDPGWLNWIELEDSVYTIWLQNKGATKKTNRNFAAKSNCVCVAAVSTNLNVIWECAAVFTLDWRMFIYCY